MGELERKLEGAWARFFDGVAGVPEPAVRLATLTKREAWVRVGDEISQRGGDRDLG